MITQRWESLDVSFWVEEEEGMWRLERVFFLWKTAGADSRIDQLKDRWVGVAVGRGGGDSIWNTRWWSPGSSDKVWRLKEVSAWRAAGAGKLSYFPSFGFLCMTMETECPLCDIREFSLQFLDAMAWEPVFFFFPCVCTCAWWLGGMKAAFWSPASKLSPSGSPESCWRRMNTQFP